MRPGSRPGSAVLEAAIEELLAEGLGHVVPGSRCGYQLWGRPARRPVRARPETPQELGGQLASRDRAVRHSASIMPIAAIRPCSYPGGATLDAVTSGTALSSLRQPGYRWLWFSNGAGSTGRWALVLVLSVQLLQVTHSSFWVGLGLFLTQGPVVLVAPFSGALADRFDRRMLNVASVSVSAVTTGLFALVTWLGAMSLPIMLALSLLFGVSFVFQMTLRSKLVAS